MIATGEEPARVLGTVLMLAAVVIVNAAVCGILSGPFARYQSRLIWLLPVAAGLVACALPIRAGRVLAGSESEDRREQQEAQRDRPHSGVVALRPSMARRRSHWLGR